MLLPFDGCWLWFVIVVVHCFALAFDVVYVLVAVYSFLLLWFAFVVVWCLLCIFFVVVTVGRRVVELY